ncbi:hypothetical protein PsorP6_013226 [Peronosclerospora sorghi]|uniref:Uncharacterized protein n=1 Tax=Peronosclerospora sorghi TaxID=230839 RepID=A0ACC0WI53_9STRA|nr:hypothetical protein PsorP6_013226 [Peronosclerospora sorghi]
MRDLDDEFARFEAEIQSLEAQTQDGNGPLEAQDETKHVVPLDVKKNHRDDEKSATQGAKMVAPQVYMAPPRPAPLKHSTPGVERVGDDSTDVVDGRAKMLNTLEDVAAHRGALSGFPLGTTGEHAATSGFPRGSGGNGGGLRSMQPRVDMDTGCLLPMEEQEMMNRQQSVYEYDPRRTAASLAARAHGKDDAASGKSQRRGGNRPKRHLRLAGGQVWEDPTLDDWPENDFRLFCGDLGNEVSSELLAHSFSRYTSFQRARVVRDKLTHKSRGYGFVSFADPFDCAKALREMNGKYIGNRPVKLSKSKWQERNIDVAKKKLRKRKRDKHLFN